LNHDPILVFQTNIKGDGKKVARTVQEALAINLTSCEEDRADLLCALNKLDEFEIQILTDALISNIVKLFSRKIYD
jgi:hypothetical protein